MIYQENLWVKFLQINLKKLALLYARDFGDLNKANVVVYGTDPQELSWQVYTEGFGGTSQFVRYNPSTARLKYAHHILVECLDGLIHPIGTIKIHLLIT